MTPKNIKYKTSNHPPQSTQQKTIQNHLKTRKTQIRQKKNFLSPKKVNPQKCRPQILPLFLPFH